MSNEIKARPLAYEVIRDLDNFIDHIKRGTLKNCVVQGLDVGIMCVDWNQVDTYNTMFLGCQLASLEEETRLRHRGAQFFAPFVGLPYNPYRHALYTAQELMEGYDQDNGQSLDLKINKHFDEHGGHDADIMEALSQRIHDYSIDRGIKDLLGLDTETGLSERKAVGIMGGHLATRDADHYKKTAQLARLLTRAGYFITSGGGPGIMEAANLGAYMSPYEETDLFAAIDILAESSNFANADGSINAGYVGQARAVINKFPNGGESLAVPTWFYGHEPVNLFARHIAKYFSNSIREDGLLAISVYGVVFAPGSAATIEEVFIDAAQNHYETFGHCSPMAFLGEGHYLQSQVYSCLAQQAVGHRYAQMITISDNVHTLLKFIQDNKPLMRR